jgi:hypothetical protein
MNTRLGIAIEALRHIRDAKSPDVFRFPDTWHSAYARQLAADTLTRIEEVKSLEERMRSTFAAACGND